MVGELNRWSDQGWITKPSTWVDEGVGEPRCDTPPTFPTPTWADHGAVTPTLTHSSHKIKKVTRLNKALLVVMAKKKKNTAAFH